MTPLPLVDLTWIFGCHPSYPCGPFRSPSLLFPVMTIQSLCEMLLNLTFPEVWGIGDDDKFGLVVLESDLYTLTRRRPENQVCDPKFVVD